MSTTQAELIGPLLRDVSRSFYLTLRVLPKEIRPQISLAYLLARATDTIADCFTVARTERLATLNNLQEALLKERPLAGKRIPLNSVSGPTVSLLRDWMSEPIASVWSAQISEAEKHLLEHFDTCLYLLGELQEDDQKLIRGLLVTIVGGQIFDIEKFPGEDKRDLTALADDKELDHYTYMVAGCVGEFWTKMCMAHLEALTDWDTDKMCELGVRFGKGLQLVNVLRDMAWDLRRGRCYLPVEQPRELLIPEQFSTIQPLYNRWLDNALDDLDAGWQYTMRVPRSEPRLRLACVWPILIGLMTIARLRKENPLDPAHRIKISRGEVYGVMGRSLLASRSDKALNQAFAALRATAR